MTKWRGKRTPEVPSRTAITGNMTFTLMLLIIDMWVSYGADDARSVIGSWLGFVAFWLWLDRTFALIIRRAGAVIEAAVAQAEKDQYLAGNTGTWGNLPNQPGAVLTVRWDPGLAGTYWVKGWISDNWQIPREIEWQDTQTLRRVIEELEIDGLTPDDDDEPTRAIRARLMVKGWADRPGTAVMGIYPRGGSERWTAGH